VRTLRGDINDFWLNLIKRAYNEKLDLNHNGKVTVDVIGEIYDPSHHPDVVNGLKSWDEVLLEFMKKWDKDGDGIVT